MPTPVAATEVLDQELLVIRSKLVDVAAALDRIDRAEGSVHSDPRLEKIHHSLAVLADKKPDRAERVQLVFSIPHKEGWRQEYGF